MSYNLVERLLKEKVDPNQGDEDGLTALHQSCIDDFEELVKGIYQNQFIFTVRSARHATSNEFFGKFES